MSTIEIDFEDFVEEVKFQMTEYEELDEDIILNWEAKARNYVLKNVNRKKWVVKSKKEIKVMIKDEDAMIEVARKFHKAHKNGKVEEYWSKFTLM